MRFITLIMVVITGGFMFLFCESQPQSESLSQTRQWMVDTQIKRRGIKDEQVLEAMGKVPRHKFIPGDIGEDAYDDRPQSIGAGQTISQPYIVAYMTEALNVSSEDTVLEIGTGSGYQAAVLAEIVSQVYSIEIVPELGEHAREVLNELGYDNVHVKIGDGYKGWPEHAPFDRIIVTCAPEEIPQKLVDQLKEGGMFVIPVGPTYGVQELVLIRKVNGELKQEDLLSVRFVPMVEGEGEGEEK